MSGFAELEVAEQTAAALAFGVPADASLAVPADTAAMLGQLQAAKSAAFDMMSVDDQIPGHEELRPIHAANGSDPVSRDASMVGVTGIDTHLVMLNSIKPRWGEASAPAFRER